MLHLKSSFKNPQSRTLVRGCSNCFSQFIAWTKTGRFGGAETACDQDGFGIEAVHHRQDLTPQEISEGLQEQSGTSEKLGFERWPYVTSKKNVGRGSGRLL